jgi:hypothetical protein
MARTREQCIADAIAKKIMANTRKRYSALHADALGEYAMATPTDGKNINMDAAQPHSTAVGTPAEGQKMRADATGNTYTVGSQVGPIVVKPTNFKSLDGSYAGDHTAGQHSTLDSTEPFKNQKGPRASAKGQAPFGKNTPSNLPVQASDCEGTEG